MLNLIDGKGRRFLQAELATLQRVFGHIALLASADELTSGGHGNYVVAASPLPLPLPGLRRRVGAHGFEIRTESWVRRFAAGARILTDDNAPVDQLLSPRAATGAGR